LRQSCRIARSNVPWKTMGNRNSLLMGAGQPTDRSGLCLPSGEEGGDGLLAGVLELLFVFGVEEIAVGVYDGKRRYAVGDGDVILLCDVDVVIDMARVNVDDDKVLCEQFGVGRLLVVVVEDLAVTTPVGAEVEEDTFVLAAGLDHGGGDVGAGICGLRVEVPIDVKGGLRGCVGNRRKNLQEQAHDYGGEKRVAEVRDHERPFHLFELIEDRMHAAGFVRTWFHSGQGFIEMMHEDHGPTQNCVGQRY
jgi:hypothetical protein